MSKKIYGVTVGTPMSPAAIAEKLKPVKTVNGVAPDENGNVEIEVGGGSDIVVVDNLGSGDSNAALSARMGGVLKTKIEDEVSELNAQLQPQINQRVKTVNGIAPDENGNVNVEGGGGSGGGIEVETDPTVPAWAKQPQKPTYTASEVGALPDSTVIPTVPSALKNPHALTFTGAVEATYDGSEAVTVEIPQGGGGSSGGASEMTEIFRLTTTEEVGMIETGIDLSQYAEVVAYCRTLPVSGTSATTHFDWYFSKNAPLRRNSSLHNTQKRVQYAHFIKLDNDHAHCNFGYGTSGGSILADVGNNIASSANTATFEMMSSGMVVDNISDNFKFGSYDGITMLEIGTEAVVYGRK